MENPNPFSNRMTFQWKYFELAKKPVLNVGCASDPMGFGDDAVHFDLDDWSAYHTHFVQGNAADLPFKDRSYDTVILGDILEHVRRPVQCISEAARVAGRVVILTIFEEWKLPGPGQWIEEGYANGDEASRALGYKDREDYQIKIYPERVGYPDAKEPHLGHINQFVDDDILEFQRQLIRDDYRILEALRAEEACHEGRWFYNWLIAAERAIPEEESR